MTRVLALAMAVFGLLSVLESAHPRQVAAVGSASVDFNGDGYADAMFRNPSETFGDPSQRGSNMVVYGSAKGLDPSTAQLWHAGVAGLPDLGSNRSFGGRSMTPADFDGDGFTDVALPLGHVSRNWADWAVLVLFGSSDGLSPAGARLLRQGQEGLGGDPSEPNGFGWSMRAGRFTTRAGVQLAVLAPYEPGGTIPGAVHLIGDLRGRLTERTLYPGPTTTPDQSDYTGSTHLCSLSSGRFNDDEADELVLWIKEDEMDGCGAKYLLYGGVPGFSGVSRLVTGAGWPRNSLGRDNSGGIIAGGRWWERIGDKAGGAVKLIYASTDGTPGPEQFFSQHSGGVPGGNENGDEFGYGTYLGDLQQDGFLDLVVGAPGEDLGGRMRVGAVTVIRRNATGVSSSGTYGFSQNSPGIPGVNEAGDGFGVCVSADDFDGDGESDILVDSWSEEIGGIEPGVVTVVYSGGSPAARLIHQDAPGIPGRNEAEDSFISCAGGTPD